MPLSSFEKGRLKILAHVREELDRAGITAESIQCKSGGILTHADTARLIVTIDGTPIHMDLKAVEVEECESIVAGDTWRKIAGLVDRVKSTYDTHSAHR